MDNLYKDNPQTSAPLWDEQENIINLGLDHKMEKDAKNIAIDGYDYSNNKTTDAKTINFSDDIIYNAFTTMDWPYMLPPIKISKVHNGYMYVLSFIYDESTNTYIYDSYTKHPINVDPEKLKDLDWEIAKDIMGNEKYWAEQDKKAKSMLSIFKNI